MIKPLAAKAPPTVGVNENVAAADVLPATRSAAAIEKDERTGRPPMTPEGRATDTNGSALVFKVVSPPDDGLPMVKPASVMVKAVAAEIAPPVTVITIELAPGEAAARVTPAADTCAVMVPEAKKPCG